MIERKRDKGVDVPAWHAWQTYRFGDRFAEQGNTTLRSVYGRERQKA